MYFIIPVALLLCFLVDNTLLLFASATAKCATTRSTIGETCGLISQTTRVCCDTGLTCDTKKKQCTYPISVMFIGNSFTIRNNLPVMFKNLVSSDPSIGVTVSVASSLMPSSTLSDHVNNPSTWTKLNSRSKWTAVVLQEQSQFLSFSESFANRNVYPYALQLAQTISSKNAMTVLFETWGYIDGDYSRFDNDDYYQMQDRIISGYEYLEGKLEPQIDIKNGDAVTNTDGVRIAPVGEAWKKVYTQLENNSKEASLYYGDEKHPSVRGSYLAACTIYATIFQKSPVGLKYVPSGVTAEFAKTIQQYAAEAAGLS